MTDQLPTIHGTLLFIENKGVLLKGPSAAGKSDLALRLISLPSDTALYQHPPRLVADDRVRLRVRKQSLWGAAPGPLEGLIEVRNVGILTMPFEKQAEIRAIINLDPAVDRERMPSTPLPVETIEGISLPVIALDPFESSAALKLIAAIRHFIAGST